MQCNHPFTIITIQYFGLNKHKEQPRLEAWFSLNFFKLIFSFVCFVRELLTERTKSNNVRFYAAVCCVMIVRHTTSAEEMLYEQNVYCTENEGTHANVFITITRENLDKCYKKIRYTILMYLTFLNFVYSISSFLFSTSFLTSS